MGWKAKTGLSSAALLLATAMILYISLNGYEVTEYSHYCSVEPENILEAVYGLSNINDNNISTRLYLNENFSSWDYCSTGWLKVLDYIDPVIDKLVIKNDSESWNVIKHSGEEDNLSLWVANAKDKKTEIGFIIRPGMTYDTVDKSLYNELGQPILDDKGKGITLKYESGKCDGKDCYHISLTDAQAVNIDGYVKLGENSIVLSYEPINYLEHQISSTNNLTITLFWDVYGDGSYWANVNDVFVNGSKYGANGTEGLQSYKYEHKSTKKPRSVGDSIVWKECEDDYYGLGSKCNVTELSLADLIDKDYDINFSVESSFENGSYITNAYFMSEEFIDPVISEGEFDGCGEIVSPGVYILNSTIGPNIATTCITINSSDVRLNCQGFGIDGVNTGWGILVDGSGVLTNVTIDNCNINDFDFAMEFFQIEDSFVNNFTGSSQASVGIELEVSKRNVLNNVHIIDCNTDAFRIRGGSDFNNLTGGSITDSIGTTIRGFRLLNDPEDNIFSGYNITAINNAAGGGIVLTAVQQIRNRFYNNFLNNSRNIVFFAGSENYYNTSFNSVTSIIGGANSGGNYWAQPNGDGYSDTCTVTTTDNICDTPYSVITNASCVGCSGFNIDELPLSFETGGAAPVDNPPSVFLNTSDNHNFTNATKVTLNATVTDDQGAVNATLYTNITGSWIANQTVNLDNATNTFIAFNLSNVPNGTYIWNILAFDNASQSNWSISNRTFFVDEPTIPVFIKNASSTSLSFNVSSPITFLEDILVLCNNVVGNGTTTLTLNGSTISNNSVQSLGTGDWLFNCSVAENDDFLASDNTSVFTVNKASPTGNMAVSGTSPITYPTTSDFTGTETNTGDLGCTYQLFADNVLVSNPDNSIYGVSNVIYNYNTTGCGNYTDGQVTDTLVVNEATTSCTISGSNSTYPSPVMVNFSCNHDQATPVLLRNGSDVTLENGTFVILDALHYNYTIRMPDSQNYTFFESEILVTVDKNGGACDVLFNETSPLFNGSDFRVFTNCNSEYILRRNGTVITNNSVQSLDVGIYNFSVERNDTVNYSNVFDDENFEIVAPGVAVCTLSTNTPVTYPSDVMVNASCTSTGGIITLYRNGVNVSDENGTFVDLGVASYTYKVNLTATGNSSSAEDTEIVEVTIATSSCSISGNNPIYPGDVQVNASCNSTESVMTLYRDGVNVTVENGSFVDLGVDVYSYKANISQSQNFTGAFVSTSVTVSIGIQNLLLDFDPGNSIINGTTVVINGSGNETTAQLYYNFTLVNNPNTSTPAQGVYNITFNTTGNVNWSSNSISELLTVTESAEEEGGLFRFRNSSGNVWAKLNADLFNITRNVLIGTMLFTIESDGDVIISSTT